MNREQQIKEQAKTLMRAYESNLINDTKRQAFIRGAKWADKHPTYPWISTNKKLPNPINIESIDDLESIQWCACHARTAYYSYFIGYYAVSIDDKHKVWCNIGGQEVCSPYDVDFYIPLSNVPNKLEIKNYGTNKNV